MIIAFNSDYGCADGWTGRRLHRLLDDVGFADVQLAVVPHVDTKPGQLPARHGGQGGCLGPRRAGAQQRRA
jgi:hypothetical protein